MKVDGSIGSLIQGISQQPGQVRKPGQVEVQENMSSDPVEGIKRRPPTEYIATLFPEVSGMQFVDFSLDGEDFNMFVDTNDIRIFDTLGVERAVTFAAGTAAYFDGEEVITTTANDITYLLNTSAVVAALTTTKSFTYIGHGLVFLLGGQFGRDYTIRLQWGANDISVTHTTPDGGVSTDTPKIATDFIADALETLLNANGTIAAAFTIHRESDVIYIENDAEDPIEITVADGDGGANFFVVNFEIRDTGDLPRYAPQGFVVRVVGDSSSGADDWYLQFQTDDTSITLGNGFGLSGKWVETVAPDTEFLMDKTTMPQTLTIDGFGDFDVAEGAWEGRQVGDSTSNEDPGFIGKAIKDIGSFQGRLVFLSGERVITSRTNKHLDFWVQSAATSVDSDPIDIESTAKGVSTTMLRMVPHNRDLVIFSEDAQFILFGRNALTPNNSSLVLTTEFEANLTTHPVSAGKNVLFAIDYGKFTGVREFFTEGASDIDNSEPITQHIPSYMLGTVKEMAGSSNFNLFLVKTTSSDKNLYPYEYLWRENQLVQAAWSTWIMADPVQHMFFRGSIVYLVTLSGGSYVLSSLDLDTTADTGLTYEVKLDYKAVVTSVTTTITNPLFGLVDTADTIIIQGTGCPTPGLRAVIDGVVGATITLSKTMGGGEVYIGKEYASRLRPTRPYVKDRQGFAVTAANFKIRDFTIDFKNLGFIEARKISVYRDTTVQKFSGMITGDPLSPLGEAQVSAGEFRFPFGDDPGHSELELFSESHLPMNILKVDWTGQYNKLGKRIEGG